MPVTSTDNPSHVAFCMHLHASIKTFWVTFGHFLYSQYIKPSGMYKVQWSKLFLSKYIRPLGVGDSNLTYGLSVQTISTSKRFLVRILSPKQGCHMNTFTRDVCYGALHWGKKMNKWGQVSEFTNRKEPSRHSTDEIGFLAKIQYLKFMASKLSQTNQQPPLSNPSVQLSK